MRLHPLAPPAWAAVAAAFVLAVPAARAELIEDIAPAVRQAEGDVVRLRLTRPAQVRQQSPLAESDLYRVRLELLATTADPAEGTTLAEFRRVAATGQTPEFTLSFAAAGGLGARDAGATGRELTIQLRERRGLTVRQGPSLRDVDLVFAPLADAPPPAAAQAPEPKPDDAALQQVEQRAAELMAHARGAIADKRFDDAVKHLNELLLLPPNRQSEQAQALAGDAWLGVGNPRRARLEYELYLKLYPTGAEADRVGQALVAAGGAVPRSTTTAAGGSAPATPAPPPAASVAGSIAQYFSSGNTKARSLVNLPAGIDQTTFTRTTERSLVTSADLSGRWSSAEHELRGVVRGSGSKSLTSIAPSSSLISSAYVDWRQLDSQLAVRLGRQSAISGGLLGSFDGVSMAWPLRQGIKLDVMGGVPAHQLVDSPRQRLLGAMLELDGLADGWGGNTYLVDQTSEGYTNRRAVGGEVRYASDAWSGYALVDYDVEFRAVNAVTLQASWLAPGQTTVTFLVDERKAPSLALANALIVKGGGSLDTLVAGGATLDELRAAALATSARARQAMLSVSRPLNPQWQLSGDLRYSEVGALPKVGDLFEATPATGAQYTFSMQATGSNLYSPRDIHSFSLAVMHTPLFKGAQLGYSNLTAFLDNDLTLEPSLRYYTQSDSEGIRLKRYSAGLRVSWRVTQRGSVLAEGLAEHATSSGPASSGNTHATSFYVGYRYELF